jgi:peroxiredoxin
MLPRIQIVEDFSYAIRHGSRRHFPDYELSDHTAKRRKLSELQGQHPMVLVLSRGGFCPKDRRQAEGLAQLHRELEVAYCRLVTISTDNITETNEYRSGVDAHWPFLSDAGRTVQKDLDIAEYTDPLHNPMIPHVIVLEPGLVIYKDLQRLLVSGPPHPRRTAPGPARREPEMPAGWDITTPELKAAWQQGRKELFYPYGKTYPRLSVNRIRKSTWNCPAHCRLSGQVLASGKLEMRNER